MNARQRRARERALLTNAKFKVGDVALHTAHQGVRIVRVLDVEERSGWICYKVSPVTPCSYWNKNTLIVEALLVPHLLYNSLVMQAIRGEK